MEGSIYKTYKHNPPHLFVPDAIYMITGATYLKESFFQDDKRKEYFLRVLIEKIIRFEWKLLYWVILDNHYHILIKSKKDASALVKVISQLHSVAAMYCNKLDRKRDVKYGGIIGIPVLLMKNHFLPESITSIITL